MDAALIRQAALLAALVAFLGRGGAPAPATVAVAGVVGLAVYGALALGAPAVRRLLAAPPADAAAAEAEAAPPDAEP